MLDVGANEGAFARRLRADGYDGRIVSFEPLAAAFALLERAAADDGDWRCLRVALGSETGTATLNVSGNLASSSFLPLAAEAEAAEPRTAYVGREEVEVTTLDALRADALGPGERALLKLDVQGLELEVLRGAERTLEQVHVVEAELSLARLYEGAPLIGEVVGELDRRGYALLALQPAFVHPRTGALLQLDGLFARA